MSEPTPKSGSIMWTDLTVANADEIRDFYKQVVGWDAIPVETGGYSVCGLFEPQRPAA